MCSKTEAIWVTSGQMTDDGGEDLCLGSVRHWDLISLAPAAWRERGRIQYHLKVKFPVSLAEGGP